MRGRAISVLGAVVVPLVFAGNAARLLLGDWFLRYEYGRHEASSFAPDERLELGQRGLEAVRPGGEGLSLLREGPFTEAEVRHLADVAGLLERLYLCQLLALAALALLLLLDRTGRALWSGALTTLAVLALAGLSLLGGFDAFFTGFHELLFAGNWRFPSDSTLIRLYPEWFWQDAVAAAAALLGVQALIALAVGWLWRRPVQA